MRLTAVVALALSLPASADVRVEARFSPRGGCAELVAATIRGARRQVRQAAYAYTSAGVADAMLERRRAGVDVALVVDDSYAHRPQVERLRAGGVAVRVDARHSIFHDKYVVVDDDTVQTGSFNYTEAAETGNAENCLVVRGDAALARIYLEDWSRHSLHSRVR